MSTATTQIPHPSSDEAGDRPRAFTAAIVFCAAAMVAALTLLGGVNLLGDRFDPIPPLALHQPG